MENLAKIERIFATLQSLIDSRNITIQLRDEGWSFGLMGSPYKSRREVEIFWGHGCPRVIFMYKDIDGDGRYDRPIIITDFEPSDRLAGDYYCTQIPAYWVRKVFRALPWFVDCPNWVSYRVWAIIPDGFIGWDSEGRPVSVFTGLTYEAENGFTLKLDGYYKEIAESAKYNIKLYKYYNSDIFVIANPRDKRALYTYLEEGFPYSNLGLELEEEWEDELLEDINNNLKERSPGLQVSLTYYCNDYTYNNKIGDKCPEREEECPHECPYNNQWVLTTHN